MRAGDSCVFLPLDSLFSQKHDEFTSPVEDGTTSLEETTNSEYPL